MFIENNFDIDFTTDFPSIANLSSFERSLIRLYHRFFIANYANVIAIKNPIRIILTDRTIYDSEAYINVYRKLKWISDKEFQKLDFILNNFTSRPYAIILNPPVDVIKNRLRKRREAATRTMRDKIFLREDSDEFIELLWKQFRKFKEYPKVLYIEDNGNKQIQKIVSWAKNLK